MRTALQILLTIGLLLLTAAALGSVSPVLDIANLVVVPAAIVTVLVALTLLALARRWLARILPVAAVLGSLVMLIPPQDVSRQCAPGAGLIRVAWLNTQRVRDAAPILAWIRRENPAIVAFGELDMGSEQIRAAVGEMYPYRQSCMRHDRCSTIIYSQVRPVVAEGLARGDAENRQALSGARMVFALADGGQLDLTALHLSRAWPPGKQERELAEAMQAIARPSSAVVIGDLNMTRRMHVLRQFADGTGLVAASADQATWPVRYGGHMLVPLIQIDHVLAGSNWAVADLRASGDLGSDHRGLVADLCPRT